MKITRYTTILAGLICTATQALSADLPSKKVVNALPEIVAQSCLETKDTALPPDIFGFGAGSDVADVGSLSAGLEYGSAFGTRAGSSNSHGLKGQVSFSPLPCFEVGPSLSGTWGRSTDNLALTRENTTAYGAAIELKYKLLGRSQNGIGLTLVTEPSYLFNKTNLSDSLVPFSSSESSRSAGNVYKALTDFAFIPDTLYGALSVEFAHNYTSAEPLALNSCAPASGSLSAWCRSSNLNVRAALSYKARDSLFLGAELQHLRSYDGAFLNRLTGQAWYVGPTFYWEVVPEKLTLSGTWATQVSGKAEGVAGSLDLTNFNRHIAKVKLGYAF